MEIVSDSRADKAYTPMLVGMYIALMAHVGFAVLFFLFSILPLYHANLVSITIYATLIYLLHKRHRFTLAVVGSTVEIVMHQVLAVLLLGWDYGFQYYLLLIPVSALIGEYRNRVLPFLLSLVSYVALLLLYGHTQLYMPHYIIPGMGPYLYAGNLLLAAIMLSAFTWIFYVKSREFESALLEVQEKLYTSATEDALTRLPNRRFVGDTITALANAAERSGDHFLLALIDIDDFKRINDTYGHEAGDRVLARVAQVMRGRLRKSDLIGRWGGEEFVVALPDTSVSSGMPVFELMRTAVEALRVEYNGSVISTTVTIGAVESGEGDIDQLLKRADDALYEGKKGSKNCVVLAR